MAAPQPPPSPQAAFARHLFPHGYPLWSPDPDLLPSDRQSVGLSIGDVGTIDEFGRFDIFFSLDEFPLLPGEVSLPPSFPPIEEANIRCCGEDILPREVVSSPETQWTVDYVDVMDVLGTTRRTTAYDTTLSVGGAHIILPQGAQLFDLKLYHRRLFEDHARRKGADWLDRYKDRLGPPRSNSIYIVTGFYKTRSWSIASFSMETAADTNPVEVRCNLVEADERLIQQASVWKPTGRFKRKIGPPPDCQGQNNQTVFMRAITITSNLPKRRSSGQQVTGVLGMLLSTSRFLYPVVEESSEDTDTDTGTSDVIIGHIPQTSQALHPSEIVNTYLLEKEPSAEIAVTHDSQWISMLESCKAGHSWTVEDLANSLESLLQERYSIVADNDVVYLGDKDLGSPSDGDVGQSFLPEDLESDITSDKEPHAHSSFANLEDIADLRIVPDELGVTNDPSSRTGDPNLKSTLHPAIPSHILSPPHEGGSGYHICDTRNQSPSLYTCRPSSICDSSTNDSSTMVATSFGSSTTLATRVVDLGPGYPDKPDHPKEGLAQSKFIYINEPSASCGIKFKNVILFGEVGSGKSSMINLMAGRDVASISSDLEACTLRATEYPFILTNPRMALRIFDTVGLEESELGLNTFIGAIGQAQKLITDLNKAGGIDLLLYCIKAGRHTVAMQRTHRLFSEILCNKRVPTAVVITNLENEPVMEDWWKRNEGTFQKYEVSATAHACITTLPVHVTLYAEKREQSQLALQKLFRDALSNNNPAYKRDVRDFLSSLVTNLRSTIVDKTFLKRRDVVRKLEERCGLGHGDAQKLAEIILA